MKKKGLSKPAEGNETGKNQKKKEEFRGAGGGD